MQTRTSSCASLVTLPTSSFPSLARPLNPFLTHAAYHWSFYPPRPTRRSTGPLLYISPGCLVRYLSSIATGVRDRNEATLWILPSTERGALGAWARYSPWFNFSILHVVDLRGTQIFDLLFAQPSGSSSYREPTTARAVRTFLCNWKHFFHQHKLIESQNDKQRAVRIYSAKRIDLRSVITGKFLWKAGKREPGHRSVEKEVQYVPYEENALLNYVHFCSQHI